MRSSTGDMLEDEGPTTDEEGDFDWQQYLAETKSTAAATECFWQTAKPPENHFRVGEKLEAVDPRNNTITSVATVLATFGPKIKLRLDGTGTSNDFWTRVDSSKIHPFGYTEEHGGTLQPPLCYEKDPVRYQTLINAAKESGNVAPRDCFMTEPPRPASNMFKSGTKLEAADTHNPTWICPATVIGRESDKIRIEYDGWGQTDLVRYDSRDLYPCGWWKQAGIKLSKPPNSKKRNPAGRRLVVRPSAGTSRPSSTTSSQVNPSTGDFQNIFDAVMEKPTSPSVKAPPDQAAMADSTSGNGAVDSTKTSTNLLTPAPTLPRHAARKSTPVTGVRRIVGNVESSPASSPNDSSRGDTRNLRPVSRVPTPKAAIAIKGALNNGVDTNSGNGEFVPQPDIVIKTADSSPAVQKVTLYMNHGCDHGPYLDITKLQRSFSALVQPSPAYRMAMDSLQLLIDSACPGATRRILEVIPSAEMKATKAFFVVATCEDSTTVVRNIPTYKTVASVKRVLYDVLVSLKACPNLLTTVETGCDSTCSELSAAKKSKLAEGGCSAEKSQKEQQRAADMVVVDKQPVASDTDCQWIGQDPNTWNVDDVVRFIGSVVDAQAAELFKRQEIDGRALVLLTPDILIKFMDFRVGPAVKISNAVERLKGKNRPNYVNTTAATAHSNTGHGENE